jgi:DNA-binding transcriptional MerR regulator
MSKPASTTLYGVSAAARRAGVSENCLRRYDRAGIITVQRDSSNKRLFTDEDIARAREYRESRVRR